VGGNKADVRISHVCMEGSPWLTCMCQMTYDFCISATSLLMVSFNLEFAVHGPRLFHWT
jgi:hypothetical protein